MMKPSSFVFMSALIVTSNCAFAQTQEDVAKTLNEMHSTGKMTEIPLIPQTGPKAAAIKKILKRSSFRRGLGFLFTPSYPTLDILPSVLKGLQPSSALARIRFMQ